MSLGKPVSRKRPLVLVLDIETEQFTDMFRKAKTTATRKKLAPQIRLCGIYNSLSHKCAFYLPEKCRDLIKELLKADIIITFNGDNFDFLVLMRHGGLSQSAWQKIQKKHIDLYQAIRIETGCSYKLDQLAYSNLGAHKKVNGREMRCLNLVKLKEANRSDLSQTYRLWQMWQRDELDYPYRRRIIVDDVGGGPHSQLPINDFDGLYINLDTEQMTEGQMAEYLAGTWGITMPGALGMSEFGELVEM